MSMCRTDFDACPNNLSLVTRHLSLNSRFLPPVNHIIEDEVCELAGLHFGCARQQTLKVIGNLLLHDGGSREVSIIRAASGHPIKSNIMTPERMTEPGLITSLSAYFGAVPWVASKMACASPTLAPGAMPSPPTCAAHASER